MPDLEYQRDAEGRTYREYYAHQVHAAIIAKGKSISAAARDAGIPVSTLSSKIRAEVPFDIDDLARLAAALEIHPAEFTQSTSFVIVGDVGDVTIEADVDAGGDVEITGQDIG